MRTLKRITLSQSFIIVCFITCTSTLKAQLIDTVYYDSEGYEMEHEAKDFAAYYEIVNFKSQFDKTGTVTRFEIDRNIKRVFTFEDGMRHGPYKIYYGNGQIWISGQYERGNEIGLAEEWYPNGQKKAERESTQISSSSFKHLLHKAWDISGNLMVTSGNGLYKSYYDNGKIKEFGNYKEGLRYGKWAFKDEQGNIIRTLEYDQYGEVINSTGPLDGQGKEDISMPRFPGGGSAWRKFVARNLKYPKEAKRANISGTVKLEVTILRDGSIAKINVLEAPHPSLANESIRVMNNSPKWLPAKVKGQAVVKATTIELAFELR